MKNGKLISEEEIQVALMKFKTEGGLIKVLPMEVVPPMKLVGKKYGIFENLMEHHATSDFPYTY